MNGTWSVPRTTLPTTRAATMSPVSSTYTMRSVIMMATQASVNPAATVIGSK
jgi:hypothetical protein